MLSKLQNISRINTLSATPSFGDLSKYKRLEPLSGARWTSSRDLKWLSTSKSLWQEEGPKLETLTPNFITKRIKLSDEQRLARSKELHGSYSEFLMSRLKSPSRLSLYGIPLTLLLLGSAWVIDSMTEEELHDVAEEIIKPTATKDLLELLFIAAPLERMLPHKIVDPIVDHLVDQLSNPDKSVKSQAMKLLAVLLKDNTHLNAKYASKIPWSSLFGLDDQDLKRLTFLLARRCAFLDQNAMLLIQSGCLPFLESFLTSSDEAIRTTAAHTMTLLSRNDSARKHMGHLVRPLYLTMSANFPRFSGVYFEAIKNIVGKMDKGEAAKHMMQIPPQMAIVIMAYQRPHRTHSSILWGNILTNSVVGGLTWGSFRWGLRYRMLNWEIMKTRVPLTMLGIASIDLFRVVKDRYLFDPLNPTSSYDIRAYWATVVGSFYLLLAAFPYSFLPSFFLPSSVRRIDVLEEYRYDMINPQKAATERTYHHDHW